MGKKKHFTQKQKLSILESAKEVGIQKAANLSGVHYTAIYEWQRKLDGKFKLISEKNSIFLKKSKTFGSINDT